MTTRVTNTRPNPYEHDAECNCDECARLSRLGVPYGETDKPTDTTTAEEARK